MAIPFLYSIVCPPNISILTLLLNLLKALSSRVPKVIPAWQVNSPVFLT